MGKLKRYINDSPHWVPGATLSQSYKYLELVSLISPFLVSKSTLEKAIKDKKIHDTKKKIDDYTLYSLHVSPTDSLMFVYGENIVSDRTSDDVNSKTIQMKAFALVKYRSVSFKGTGVKGYQIIGTGKHPSLKLSSWMKQAYATLGGWVVTDETNTDDSKNVWEKWIKTPFKYGIEEIKILIRHDSEFEVMEDFNINSIWADGNSNILVAVKFKTKGK